MPSVFMELGGSFAGPGGDISGLSSVMSAGMIQANIMAAQVAQGTFIGARAPSLTGPTIADRGVPNVPMGSDWITGSNWLSQMPKLSPSFILSRKQISRPVDGLKILSPPTPQKGSPVVAPKVQIQPRVSRSPTPNLGVGLPTNLTKEPNVALDLGTLITGLGTAYIENKYAPQIQPVFNPFSSIPEYLGFSGGGDGGSIVDQGGAICPVPKGFYITPSGELRKKAKRRRRRLATPSDIKDLAALSSVTTQSEKKQWIATHPS